MALRINLINILTTKLIISSFFLNKVFPYKTPSSFHSWVDWLGHKITSFKVVIGLLGQVTRSQQDHKKIASVKVVNGMF